jgi:acetate kinase
MRALVLNAGSSSLKFAVYAGDGRDALAPLFKGSFERIGLDGCQWSLKEAASDALLVHGEPVGHVMAANHGDCVAVLVERLKALDVHIDCAGHRVVHGGPLFTGPVEINGATLKKLEALTRLAPLHQPHNIAGIRALQVVLPGVPQVACFDTAFHTTQPRIQQMYALPRELTDSGVRAYGFHGLSYESISGQPELAQHSRVVVAHLGNGASVCAIRDRKSVASSMGFTALDGLPMGTRTGSIDAGVLLHLLRSGMSVDQLETLLYKSSGLLGISGVSSDVRDLLASDSPAAVEAMEYFCEKAAQHIARMAVTVRGVDALVFTGGIGENAASVREGICERLSFLGMGFDRRRNADNPKDKPPFRRRISLDASPIAAYVIPTDEERVIAGHAAELLARAIAA